MKGKEISRWSTWDNLECLKSFHPPLELERPKIPFLPEKAKRKDKTPWGGNYDYYRLNSIQILPKNNLEKKDSRFKQGNWLISFRHGSMIFILDENKRVVWKCLQNEIKDNIEGQHSPFMLPNGNILMLDNGRYRGWSRIIELNPQSMQIEWEYKSPYFFSLSQGYVQMLPNGNLLITESEKGHVFELTPEKEIVWEFYHSDKKTLDNPKHPENSAHPESIGEREWIYRMTRYPKQFIEKIIKQNSKN
jgi:hypothetical protein